MPGGGNRNSRIHSWWSEDESSDKSESADEGSILYRRVQTPDSIIEVFPENSATTKFGTKMDDSGLVISEEVPQSVRSLLHAWYKQHQEQSLPCTISATSSDPNRTDSGIGAHWQHASGEALTARIYKIHDNRACKKSKSSQQAILVVKGTTYAPRIVKYSPASNNIYINYKAWIWPKGDSNGFELQASVTKVVGSQKLLQTTADQHHMPLQGAPEATPSLVSLNVTPSTVHPSLTQLTTREGCDQDAQVKDRDQSAATSLRPRESLLPAKKISSLAASERTTKDFAKHLRKRKHEDIEIEVDRETLLDSFRKTWPERSAKQVTKDVKDKHWTSHEGPVENHIAHNTVLLFRSTQTIERRVRLLYQCESVHKLFAQAIAGDVFGPDATNGSRVLSLGFGIGAGRKDRKIVEGDLQDFEGFLQDLMKIDECWRETSDGILRGCLAVEVTAA